jgi:hypothetical protein
VRPRDAPLPTLIIRDTPPPTRSDTARRAHRIAIYTVISSPQPRARE